jgi:Long-chain acyl-CoA synthetases (AMP-forming)
VGNWAERRNLAYTSYADLAQKPEVYELVREAVGRVNASLAEDPELTGAQIRKFLVLHKELDADDQEITRTRKVRRGFIAQKYAALIEGLYSGAAHVNVEAQVTYEDGRVGTVRADVRIADAAVAVGA